MYNKKNFNKKLQKRDDKSKKQQETKEKRTKKSFDLPSFINSDGVVITQTIGVKVPYSENDKHGEKKVLLEMALRYFKRKVKEAGILEEYKHRMEYVKKSAKKRRQKLEAIRRRERDSLMI